MKRTVLFFFLITILFSCTKSHDKNCGYDACAIVAPAAEVTQLETYLSSNSIVATKHCGGLYYIIDAPGTGASPTVCSNVSVNYQGKLTNGATFDQSTAPVTFPLSNLIEAWKKTIPLIKTGGKIKMWIPPSLGYGNQDIKDNQGHVVIPANSILYFEVELVAVQ